MMPGDSVVTKPPSKSIPLSREILSYILKNVDEFDALLDEEERIILTAKEGAHITLPTRVPVTGQSVRTMAPLRPKFIYSVKRREYGPEQAKAFGMSKPRLRVYEIVYAAGTAGVGYKAVRDQSGLQHGSVMQILHWLRKQDLIIGIPEQ